MTASGSAFTITDRLAFGLLVRDGLDRNNGADVHVTVEWPGSLRRTGAPVPGPMPAAWRRMRPGMDIGRFGVVHGPGVHGPVALRITDPVRRFVPRRLLVPFPSLDAVLAAEAASQPTPLRRWAIGVWPGAGSPLHGSVTGVRGRIVDGSRKVVPWARISARHPDKDIPVGVAHGDDRGEFLLAVGSGGDAAAIPKKLDIGLRITVFLPPGLPSSNAAYPSDPLAALLVEKLSALGGNDAEDGTTVPDSYVPTPERTVALRVGRLLSIGDVTVATPVPP